MVENRMFRVCKATLQSNGVKKVTHDNADHLVVPVVMIVDGVLNDTLVTHEVYGQLVEAWNDKPVTINHPQVNGQDAGAGSPDIIEKTGVGRVYNARVDGNKLVGEIWADVSKLTRLNQKDLLAVLESGGTVEVSTGYFSNREEKSGEFNGQPYSFIDTIIIPDHLALLPNDVGACSIEDGCGTNASIFNKLINQIAQATGLCKCSEEEKSMSTKVEELVGNAKLTDDQLKALEGLDEGQIEAVMALNSHKPEPEPVIPAEVKVDTAAIVAEVTANLKRDQIVERIATNAACVLGVETLKTMSAEDLEKYEASIRPADYSGAGGVVVHSTTTENVVPFSNGGLVGAFQKKEG